MKRGGWYVRSGVALAALILVGGGPAGRAADDEPDTPKKASAPERAKVNVPPPAQLDELLKGTEGLSADQKKRLREALEQAQRELERAKEQMQRARQALDLGEKGARQAGEKAREDLQRASKRLSEVANAMKRRMLEGPGQPLLGAFPPDPREGVRLGIMPAPPGETLADQLNLPKGKGVVVARVLPDSPAARAGIKRHDVLLEINGKPVPRDPEGLRQLLAGVKPGAAIDAVVIRRGKRETLRGLKLSDGQLQRPPRPEPQPPPRRQTEQPPAADRPRR